MRSNVSTGKPLSRFALWLATTSLALTTPLIGIAQPAPPSGAPAAPDIAGQPNTDPPPIAGSLASMAGKVSFHAAGETQWSPATLNYPVTNGEGFWTEPQASATIDIADDHVVLDESTEFDVITLDQSQFVATETQGAIFAQLRTVTQGQTLIVNTPRGTVQISQAGEYEIVAGDTNDATTITVVRGAAHISGTSLALDVGPNQTATITGSDTPQGTVDPIQTDAFLTAQLQLLAQPHSYHASVPPVCQFMTGSEQLASYGSFTQTSQYGQVWYPRDIPTNWAPYRDGHWSYVSPWGWTWVDNARWGFAPFHYGRWAQIEGRWGWIPGGGASYVPGSYPIYSPALVSFIGVGAAGLGFSLSIGAGGYAPAWIPLGPHEAYYPWYHVREGYFSRINSFYGVPRDIINRGPTYINTINIHQNNVFINRAAATVISPAAFARGQSVLSAGHPLPERAFAEARPLGGQLAVRPTAFTPNLSPEAARRFDVPVPARPLHVAAGPRIVPFTPGTRAIPELRRTALPQNVRGVPVVARPGLAQPRPGEPAVLPGEVARPREIAPRPGEAARAGIPALRPGEVEHPSVPGVRQGEAARPAAPALRPDGAARPVVPALRPGETAGRGEPARPAGEAAKPGGAPVGHDLAAPRGPVTHPQDLRGPAEPGTHGPTELARPNVPAARPEARAPDAIRPQQPVRPGAAHPGPESKPEVRPQSHPETAPHAETHAPVHQEARAVPHEPALHAAARPEATRPAAPRPETRELPRQEPRAAPRPELSRPEVHHVETPRPAARPAGHPEEKHMPQH